MSDDVKSEIAEKFNSTGAKIVEISNKIGASTKKAIGKTNQAVKNIVEESKDKLEERKKKKNKEDLQIQNVTEEGVIILEQLQKLSQRVDSLEIKIQNLKTSPLSDKSKPTSKKSRLFSNNKEEIAKGKNEFLDLNDAMVEVIHILGASILWIVALIGVDKFVESKDLQLGSIYSLEPILWSIGAFTWILYILHRLAKSGIVVSTLVRIQLSIAVGLITLMSILMNNDSMEIVSSVWTWGILISLGVIIGSSIIATSWRSTKRLVWFGERKK